MMLSLELLVSVIAVASCGVGVVMWFARLEGKTDRANERLAEHKQVFQEQLVSLEVRIDARRHEDMQSALLSRSEVMDTLQVIQNDIKTLLTERASR